jgi:hypothetical protein
MLAGRWDKRRKKRQPKHQAAWISRGAQTPPIPCVLCDISREGARLAPARFNALPDVFTLILSKDGSARRLCRIVWRKKLHIGVQFIVPAESVSDGQRKHAAAQPPGAKQAGVPDACRWHVYETNPAACTDRKELAISSLAAIVMWLLIIATAIFYAAGTEMGDAAGWAVKLCQDARNFCQHPEWSGIPAALMSLVYFTVRGMEL